MKFGVYVELILSASSLCVNDFGARAFMELGFGKPLISATSQRTSLAEVKALFSVEACQLKSYGAGEYSSFPLSSRSAT